MPNTQELARQIADMLEAEYGTRLSEPEVETIADVLFDALEEIPEQWIEEYEYEHEAYDIWPEDYNLAEMEEE